MVSATDNLVKRLSDAYDVEDTSNVYKFLTIIGLELDGTTQALADSLSAHNVNEAGGASLDSVGEMVDEERLSDESDESYRTRLRGIIPGLIGGGTTAQLRKVIKEIIPFSVDDDIVFEEPEHPAGTFGHLIILIDNTELKAYEAKLTDLLNRAKAAGILLVYAGPRFKDDMDVTESFTYALTSVMTDEPVIVFRTRPYATLLVSESFTGIKTGVGNFAENINVTETEGTGVGWHRVDITQVDSLNVIR